MIADVATASTAYYIYMELLLDVNSCREKTQFQCEINRIKLSEWGKKFCSKTHLLSAGMRNEFIASLRRHLNTSSIWPYVEDCSM